MEYGIFRSHKTGYRVGKSFLFAIGMTRYGISRPTINGMWNTLTSPPPPPPQYQLIDATLDIGSLFSDRTSQKGHGSTRPRSSPRLTKE